MKSWLNSLRVSDKVIIARSGEAPKILLVRSTENNQIAVGKLKFSKTTGRAIDSLWKISLIEATRVNVDKVTKAALADKLKTKVLSVDFHKISLKKLEALASLLNVKP